MTRTPKDHGRQDDAGPASGSAGPAFVTDVDIAQAVRNLVEEYDWSCKAGLIKPQYALENLAGAVIRSVLRLQRERIAADLRASADKRRIKAPSFGQSNQLPDELDVWADLIEGDES